MDELSLAEIRRRVHFLEANFGFARRLLDGATKLVGALTPYPQTEDAAWNKESWDHFYHRAKSEELFDLAGRFDFWGWQRVATRSRFRDGDHLSVLTEGDSGAAQMAFYEAHQIRSAAGAPERLRAPMEKQGVVYDRHGKHLGYRVRDGIDPEQSRVIARRDALYHGMLRSHGQIRGHSVFTTSVCNMIDVVETRGFTKLSLKSQSRIGTVIERDLGTVSAGPGAGLGGQVLTTQEPDGRGGIVPVNWELVYAGGQVPRMAPGERVRVLQGGQPHQNQQEFERSILRDCVWGWDLPYEALCEISGVTGPAVRFLMNEVDRWTYNEHELLAKLCHRWWVYDTAKEIEAGRLREPNDARWWQQQKVLWVGQRGLTIDRGREGQLAIVQLGAGLTTWADEWGEWGEFWQDKVDQRVREVAYAQAQCEAVGLTLSDVFPAVHPAQLEAIKAEREMAERQENENDRRKGG